MAAASTGITFRTIQEAMPEYHIDADLIGGVLTAMPPPPSDASPSSRRARLTRIIEEIAARVPMDAAQGHLAGQIVVVQFLADETLGGLTAPGLPLAERRLAIRTADDLLRSVVRLERALERRQTRVLPFRDVGAVGGFDLDALGGVWARGVEVAVPLSAAPVPEAGPAPGTPEPATPQAERDVVVIRPATCGGNPDARVAVGRAGVTLEQGDGWSLEVWPARAGAAADPVVPGHGMPDRGMPERAIPDRGMPERAAAHRPGKWGAA